MAQQTLSTRELSAEESTRLEDIRASLSWYTPMYDEEVRELAQLCGIPDTVPLASLFRFLNCSRCETTNAAAQPSEATQ